MTRKTKKTILVDTPFEWNNPISFDTEGRTKGKVCGMRLGWLPEGWGTGYTQTAYDVIAQRDAEQAQSLPQDERELVVYTYDLFAVQDVRKDYSVQCMSANTVAGCDFLCGGTRTEITKQGTIGPYDASWVETHWQRSSPGSDAPEEWTTQMLLLYDREKLCVVIISADWDDAERIAANLEIVETSVDAPAARSDERQRVPLDRRRRIVGNGLAGTRPRCSRSLLSSKAVSSFFPVEPLMLGSPGNHGLAGTRPRCSRSLLSSKAVSSFFFPSNR